MNRKFRCKVCGYIYNEESGDAATGIEPGTPFEELPAGWRCPVCSVPKDEFDAMI